MLNSFQNRVRDKKITYKSHEIDLNNFKKRTR